MSQRHAVTLEAPPTTEVSAASAEAVALFAVNIQRAMAALEAPVPASSFDGLLKQSIAVAIAALRGKATGVRP